MEGHHLKNQNMDSEKEEMFTAQRRETSGPAGTVGGADHDRPSASDCKASGGNQPGGQVSDTGKRTLKKTFQKRRSSTSKPEDGVEKEDTNRRRSTSGDNTLEVIVVRDEEGTSQATPKRNKEFEWPTVKRFLNRSSPFIGQSDKKRRRNSLPSPSDKAYKRKECSEALVIQEAIRDIKNISLKLYTLAMDTYPNTQRDIKNAITALRTIAGSFDSAKQWLEDRKYEEIDAMKIDIESQTSPRKIRACNIETQTPPWMANEDGRARVELIEDLPSFLEQEKKEWPEESYTCTKIRIGNPIDSEDSTVKVILIEPTDTNMERSIQKLYRERYQEVKPGTEKFQVLEQNTKIRSGTETKTIKRKIIKINLDGTDNTLWEALCQIREETINDKDVALHHLEGMETVRFRKMIEAVFIKNKNDITIYTTKNRQETQRIKRFNSVVDKAKRHKTEAIILEQKGKKYNEVLNSVKNIVRQNRVGANITDVRETRDGRLLVEVTEGANEIIEKMKENMKEIKIEHKTAANNRKTLHIHALDSTMTREEVHESLVRHLRDEGHESRSLYVGELRPSNRGRQAVTVTTDNETAGRLLQMRVIMGITPCRITERLDFRKCVRCWEAGHEQNECKGKDRRNTCLNCGEEGHLIAKCQSAAACPLCQKKGHKAWTPGCDRFKDAVKQTRNGNNTKDNCDKIEKTNGNKNSENSCDINMETNCDNIRDINMESNCDNSCDKNMESNCDNNLVINGDKKVELNAKPGGQHGNQDGAYLTNEIPTTEPR